MSMRIYTEDSLGLSSCNESAIRGNFTKMQTAMKKVGLDPFKNVSEITRTPEYMKLITESVKLSADATANKYVAEDMARLNTLYENVGAQMLNEAVSSVADLSPIMMNSFGIQERALISAHLPRAVKQVTAKVDNFKLTERIPYIVDLAGNKSKFIDAFVPGADGAAANLTLREVVVMGFNINDTDINLYEGSGADVQATAANYRPAVSTANAFGIDSALDSVVITGDPTDVAFEIGSLRSPDAENGTFRATVTWTKEGVAQRGMIMGQFDLSNGKLVTVTASHADITAVKFKMVLSPETHNNALSVGYDTKHTPVNIPVGDHFEYGLSEEFKDASDKYYNVDAMALLTDYMGRAVEQVKDIVTLGKYQELADGAVLTTTFNCTPTSSFAQGKEEFIRREFGPFIEKVCIILKNKVRIPNCHFRVVGNPLDIRIAASAGTEYIYKRNEQFAGEIGIDYEFSVTSDVHKIFYLSSERVPVGRLFVFLIPNSIENNISTVNHYEYATYVSNKYRNTKNNLPTVMISTRYLTKEYYPVVACIEVVNNLVDDDSVTTATGTGMESAVYAKISYVNA